MDLVFIINGFIATCLALYFVIEEPSLRNITISLLVLIACISGMVYLSQMDPVSKETKIISTELNTCPKVIFPAPMSIIKVKKDIPYSSVFDEVYYKVEPYKGD
jgi:hypothetical protein